tara:strand:+ start:227 stop:733 length:507 start_codon:yes stop_codon:yes gene_type:complete
MDEIYLPNLPDTNNILNPPKTIFYPPVAEIPYLDPILLPSLEQVSSGLGEDQATDSSKKEEANEEGLNINPEQIPMNLPQNLENTSSETVATFSIPLIGEFPIPAPEIIASSVISAGVASTVTVAGSIAMQAVVTQLKKVFKKIFTKVLKKEVANLKKKGQDSDEQKS